MRDPLNIVHVEYTPDNPIINSKYCCEFIENEGLIEGIWFE